MVASIQYRAMADNASDAFYKLSNTKGQIQAYVFDGIDTAFNFDFLVTLRWIQHFFVLISRTLLEHRKVLNFSLLVTLDKLFFMNFYLATENT